MKYTDTERDKMPLLGLCPIGKFVFSLEDAKFQKKKLEEKLTSMNVPFVNIDNAVEDGIVRGSQNIDPAVKCLKNKGVKAVFMPHCNFGTEHAVGLIGRDLGVPLLIWGPRDEAPLKDGTRLRDTLCGLFASTKVLYKMGVPYTYVENCRTDEFQLEKGIDTFLRAANIAETFKKGIKIGHFGQRIDFFWTTIINESELLDRFKIEVLPIDMVAFIKDTRSRVSENRKEYENELKEMKKKFSIEGFESDEPMLNVFAARDQILTTVKEHKLDAIAFQCFPSVCDELNVYSFAFSSAVSELVPFGYESDIHGAISCLMMKKAVFDSQPAYLTEYTVRHPENDNAVLLWHAGAPYCLCDEKDNPKIGKHWILPSPLSGMPHFKLKEGNITVARFDGDHGNYKLAFGEGKTVEGPKTQNNYIWMEVENWLKWEKILMNGPFIHHTAMIYGSFADAMAESCNYINGLEGVELDNPGNR